MRALRPIVFGDKVFDEYLGIHAGMTALSAVDFLATRKFRQHLLAHFGYLAPDSSALARRDIDIIAPCFVHNVKASPDIRRGCHGLDADCQCQDACTKTLNFSEIPKFVPKFRSLSFRKSFPNLQSRFFYFGARRRIT